MESVNFQHLNEGVRTYAKIEKKEGGWGDNSKRPLYGATPFSDERRFFERRRKIFKRAESQKSKTKNF